MTRTAKRLALVVGLLMAIAACSTPTTPSDSGDAGVDIESDRGADTGFDIASDQDGPCTNNASCDNGVFCDGVERCSPSDPAADSRGCAPPAMIACRTNERCDEARAQCVTLADSGVDAAAECDRDRDGQDSIACGGADCDDDDPLRYRGNPERCTGMLSDGRSAADHDEDCDPCSVTGAAPDGDADGDGFAETSCVNPWLSASPVSCVSRLRIDAASRTVRGADCNDDPANSGAMQNPENPEVCGNMLDDNCDGNIDDMGASTWFEDRDGDGYGAMALMVMGCTRPGPTFIARGGDCNDNAAGTYPGAPELCDRFDNNCDNTVGSPGGPDLAEDSDSDSHSPPTATCIGRGEPGAGPLTFMKDDCSENPENGTFTYPGAPELCDGRDNNCSSGGGADSTEDADGDRHSSTAATCLGTGELGASPVAMTFLRDDCDDTRPETYRGAPEQCDLRDNDCNLAGLMAGGVDSSEDVDGDGHTGATVACLGRGVAGAIAIALPRDDCDDSSNTTYPGAPEFCDRIDSDCSLPGPMAGGAETNEDVDGDGHSPSSAACAARGTAGAPTTAFPNDDCNDASATDYPGAVELCDALDNDCDRTIDDGATASCGAQRVCGAGVCESETRISAGDNHTCAVRSSGGVACWGTGRLGSGSYGTLPSPTAVSNITDAVEVASGESASCARLRSGTVQCWGSNFGGQVGDGTLTDRTVPVPVVGISDVVEIGAGQVHACARLRSGTVMCWGRNTSGEVGDGTTVLRSAPVAVTGLTDAVEISVGRNHTCARRSTGEVVCWGAGFGGTTLRTVGGLTDAVEISAGYLFNCARRSNGTVLCWGSNSNGQLGNGTTTASSIPVAVLGLDDVVEIDTGKDHACARQASGAVLCWGLNAEGQLGDGTVTRRLVPTVVSSVTEAAEISAGLSHTCARLTNNSVRCWGSNFYGQLGDGSRTDSIAPATVNGLTDSVELAVSYSRACARQRSGSVLCWGAGRTAPALVPGLDDAAEVSAGNLHTCARRASGSVVCWGSNTYGQLGDGSTTSRASPTTVVGLDDAVEISAGYFHTCARRASGFVVCWGRNSQGEIGDGSTTNRSIPTAVSGSLGAVAEISARGEYSCARRSTGQVLCWGRNAEGQLGNGTTGNAFVPGLVSNVTSAVEIATSPAYDIRTWSHSCARTASNSVTCWGGNSNGELGDGSFTRRLTPTTFVSGLSDAAEIASGLTHSCARRATGEVVCWGSGSSGELGSAATGFTPTPVGVVGITSAVEIGVGQRFSCARPSVGAVMCWGDNDVGQLGDGTNVVRGSVAPIVEPL